MATKKTKFTYDSKELEVEGGYTATLPTEGKKMRTNIEIKAPEFLLQNKVAFANGDVTPDSGYDGLGMVTVNISEKAPTLQEKPVTPSEAEITVTPDPGYDALSKVTVAAIQTEKTSVTPTKAEQSVTPSKAGKYLKQVTVNPIPDEYIIPSGNLPVGENKTYDVTQYSSVDVNVPIPDGYNDTTGVTAIESQVLAGKVFYGANGKVTGAMEDNGYTSGDYSATLDADLPRLELDGAYKGSVSINIKNPSKITKNGTYPAEDATVMTQVEVDVPIPDGYNYTKGANAAKGEVLRGKKFYGVNGLEDGDMPDYYSDGTFVATLGKGNTSIDLNGAYRGTVEIDVENPVGTKKITSNGIYNAANYTAMTQVEVDVPIPDGYINPSGTKPITTNGTHNVNEFENVDVNVQPALQPKTVTPTKAQQPIQADSGYYGLSQVTVRPIPDNYIIPSGTVDLSENRVYDVTQYAKASISVPIPDGYINPSGTKNITENGTHNVNEFESAYVNVRPPLQNKTVTPARNSQIVSSDDSYYGLSEVTVNGIPSEYNVTTGANAAKSEVLEGRKFYGINGLEDGGLKNNGTIHETLYASKTSLTLNGAYWGGEVDINIKNPPTITTNGTYTAESETVMSQVTVNVQPSLQKKSVTPTKSSQPVSADEGYYGLSQVTVNPIPSNYIVPSGTVNISENKTVDVTQYASATVNVRPPLQDKTVTPAKNSQVISPDDSYYGLSGVTVNPIPSNYNDTSGANATRSQVLTGKKFYGLSGMDTGSMEDNGYTNGDSAIFLSSKYPSLPLHGAYSGTAEIEYDEDRTVTENGTYHVVGNITVAIPTETWVLTLKDDSTVTKEVSVTYTSGGTTKTFTIDGETKKFEEGMTWYQWVGSDYASDSYTCAGNDSRVKPTGDTYIVDRDGEEVLGWELIHAGDPYYIEEDA